MDFHPNRFRVRIRVLISGFNVGCTKTPPNPNTTCCRPYSVVSCVDHVLAGLRSARGSSDAMRLRCCGGSPVATKTTPFPPVRPPSKESDTSLSSGSGSSAWPPSSVSSASSLTPCSPKSTAKEQIRIRSYAAVSKGKT